jgi:hypothetical protein
MKNIYVELTDSDGDKFLLNVLHVAWIEPNKKGGCIIKSNWLHNSLNRKVKESYEEIKALIASLDNGNLP